MKTTGDKARVCALGGRRRLLPWAVLSVVACGDSSADPPVADSGSDSGTMPQTSTTTAATSNGASSGDTTGGEGVDSSGTNDSGWMTSLELDDTVGALYSVWGPSPDNLYAVASQPLDGGLSAGAVYRWDGTDWSAEDLEEGTPGLNWVFGRDDTRFAVGELGAILVRDGDSGAWNSHTCGTILPLWGVWGAAPDDAWAVGGDGFNRDPIACHFDGETWTLTEFSELSFESHALYKVWGTAADNVWAVGDEGLILHYTGAKTGWTEVPSGANGDLISIWGTGPTEILAVGGRSGGILSRYDGTSWQTETAPEFAGLNGVWMAADGTSTIVGPQGGIGVVEPGQLAPVAEDSGTFLALHGVFGFDGGARWSVGGSLDMPPPHVGVALVAAP